MNEDTRDVLRSAALATACGGFVAIPNVGALIGRGEQTGRYDTVITPPDYAFIVWAPIFAGCLASTVAQCLPAGRSQPLSRRTGWPLAGAYATNALWSIAAQRDRFALTPVILPVATAFAAIAHTRMQRVGAPSGWMRATPTSTALLLGWTTLASTVNIAAGAVQRGAQRSSRRTVTTSTTGLLAVSAVAAAAVVGSRQGSLPLAAASGWGLITTACASGRPLAVRLAAAVGGLAVAAAAARRAVSPLASPAT